MSIQLIANARIKGSINITSLHYQFLQPGFEARAVYGKKAGFENLCLALYKSIYSLSEK
jgi:hypothetical protein